MKSTGGLLGFLSTIILLIKVKPLYGFGFGSSRSVRYRRFVPGRKPFFMREQGMMIPYKIDKNNGGDDTSSGEEKMKMNQECIVKDSGSISHLPRQNDDNDDDDDVTSNHSKPIQKIHSMTVCMVPPPKFNNVWEAVTKARTELKDPGLYRWPPHANLLYPFLDVHPKMPKLKAERKQMEDIIIMNEDDGGEQNDDNADVLEDGARKIYEQKLQLLSDAVQKIEPFRVSLDSFGTFGGASRGVLYLYPRSYEVEVEVEESSNDIEKKEVAELPLVRLQSLLFENFPECPDQQKHGGNFTPHVTLSHFANITDALDGQARLEAWWTPVEFDVTEIYLLKRVGDDGQFKIIATLPLGSTSCQDIDIASAGGFQAHEPALAFPGMPINEADWVREERMKLKARRNGNGRRGNRRQRRTSRRKNVEGVADSRAPSRTRDSPEVIAQKRAERAEKKERLAREMATAAILAAIEGQDDIQF